ncbi:DUF6415 family natural product biosynthesis protein [Streptomyces umbrinus]|uniref:DUF6415 family natural product biosynthesis protein n=1 Tax=Streptomyces umbrinus TaxID=67370 RepID=UPI0035936D37
MRADAAQLIGDDAELPETTVLPQLIQKLRGHLMVLIPHAEDRAQTLSRAAGPSMAALAGVGEARRRMSAALGLNYISEIKYAQDLARSVDALCRHVENAAPAEPRHSSPHHRRGPAVSALPGHVSPLCGAPRVKAWSVTPSVVADQTSLRAGGHRPLRPGSG